MLPYTTQTPIDEIIGKRISSIKVSDDCLSISDSDGKLYSVAVSGDCCSESWWADIYGAEHLIDSVAIDVLEADLANYNSDDGRGRQEAESVYGFSVLTDSGVTTFIFRNSSNGYYGGWMSACRDCSDLDMQEVSSTWKNESYKRD